MSELGSGCKFVKFLLFLFNLIFWCLGLALIIVGALVLDKYGSVFSLASSENHSWSSGPALIIAIGSIIFVVAFFGCFGAIRESRCLLYTFSVLLFILFVVTLTGAILVAVYRNQIKDDLHDVMWNSMKKYETDKGVHKAWDNLQSDWPKCCGTYSYNDWGAINVSVPKSCCVDTDCTKYRQSVSKLLHYSQPES
jgi:CD63 antigen